MAKNAVKWHSTSHDLTLLQCLSFLLSNFKVKAILRVVFALFYPPPVFIWEDMLSTSQRRGRKKDIFHHWRVEMQRKRNAG